MPTTKPSKICCHGRLIAEIIWSLEKLGSISGSSRDDDIYILFASSVGVEVERIVAVELNHVHAYVLRRQDHIIAHVWTTSYV